MNGMGTRRFRGGVDGQCGVATNCSGSCSTLLVAHLAAPSSSSTPCFEKYKHVIVSTYRSRRLVALFLPCSFCGTRLRGTCVGANNRMDILSLITAGIQENEVPGDEEDVLEVLEGWEDAESHNPDVPAVKHKRGMAPFVFVSFDDVRVLNTHFFFLLLFS